MTAQQLIFATRHYRNQQLFSDHYLGVTLPTHPAWTARVATVAPLLQAVESLVGNFSGGNEAQTEEHLVRPILKLLGHHVEVQSALATPSGTQFPDYVFYRDAVIGAANRGRTLAEADLRASAYAVGDAKAWERKLDVAVGTKVGDPLSNRTPAYQDRVLRAAERPRVGYPHQWTALATLPPRHRAQARPLVPAVDTRGGRAAVGAAGRRAAGPHHHGTPPSSATSSSSARLSGSGSKVAPTIATSGATSDVGRAGYAPTPASQSPRSPHPLARARPALTKRSSDPFFS